MAKKKTCRGQGEGNLRQRKNGSWEARYTLGYDAEGKQIQKSVYGKSREDVNQKLIKILSEVNNGTYIEPTRISINNWFDTWMEEYKKPYIRPTTYDSYKWTIDTHIRPDLGHILIKDLRPEKIQKLYNEMLKNKLSPRTIKYVHSMLHGALQQAVKNNLIIRNVADAVMLPKQQKKDIKVLTKNEQKKFIEALSGNRLKAAFILMLSAGLRRGELIALKWQDIDFEKKIIKIVRNAVRIRTFNNTDQKTEIVFGEPKSATSKRIIPLLDSVIIELQRHKKQQLSDKIKAIELFNDNDFIFTDEQGNLIDPRQLDKIFKKILEKAGIKNFTLHGLRHTFATRGLEAGVEAKVMQELLGHSTITMTYDLYTHVLEDTKRSAIDKLDKVFKVN